MALLLVGTNGYTQPLTNAQIRAVIIGISFYASTGLTDASPRLGAGLALKFSR